jgi:hypothetical protein
MRRLTWRIPNVALSCPVDIAEDRRVAPAKRSGQLKLPPCAVLDAGLEHYLFGPRGSRWRIEVLPDGEVVAHEM